MTTETLLDAGTDSTAASATDAGAGADASKTADQSGEAKADAGSEDKGKPADGQKTDEGAPEKYEDFKPIDGVKAPSTELMTEFTTLAKELGMSQAKAQDAFALVAKLAEKGAAGVEARNAAVIEAARVTQSTQWAEASKTDKEFGGEKLAENLAVAKAAMNATTTPELRKLLNESGLGNNPEIIRHFLTIAPAFKESKHVTGGRASKDGTGQQSLESAAQVLYPTMASK